MTKDETIEGLQEIIDRNKNTLLPRVHIGYLIHAVKYLKIVKCKDCKWRGHENDSPKWIPCLAIRTNNDWFCADGAYKENNNDRSYS